MIANELSWFKGNRFGEIILKLPCPQRILMVTDGPLNFGTGFFGLSEFVGIVASAGHTVSTAHRSGTGPVTLSGAFKFDTASPPVTTANYDQIWLFGFSAAPLDDPAERTTIAQFMKNGGGVFATGDHETLGAGMGNNIPRVRKMRNWASIPMVSPDRLDTVVNPGVDAIKQFDDQADPFPQPIFPFFFSNGGPDTLASSWSVHPVLRHSSGAVDCLPDHPHESECLAPLPAAGSFAGVEEWPAPTGGGPRIAARVVAVSVSAGRFIVSGAPTPTGTKPPVAPRCFGGHFRLRWGRGWCRTHRLRCDVASLREHQPERGRGGSRHQRNAAHRSLRERVTDAGVSQDPALLPQHGALACAHQASPLLALHRGRARALRPRDARGPTARAASLPLGSSHAYRPGRRRSDDALLGSGRIDRPRRRYAFGEWHLAGDGASPQIPDAGSQRGRRLPCTNLAAATVRHAASGPGIRSERARPPAPRQRGKARFHDQGWA